MAPGNGRDFNCTWEHCGKSFNRKSDLCRHYRIHTNERPYHCTVKDCNKSFIQRSALTVHSRTHTGEKPHVCDHEGCQKAFSDSSSLARHRRIHTGKRPYICQEPTCERSFCRKTTLTKHQHRSHPPGSMTRPSSEDATSEHSYQHHQPPVTVSIPNPNDQYLLAQQPYYPKFRNSQPRVLLASECPNGLSTSPRGRTSDCLAECPRHTTYEYATCSSSASASTTPIASTSTPAGTSTRTFTGSSARTSIPSTGSPSTAAIYSNDAAALRSDATYELLAAGISSTAVPGPSIARGTTDDGGIPS
ncbi:uncharacterized protein N7483_004585 [Penicillium malachiteum]|uniref:uncharacterized protein n=1 Tax=Penicillium malachiteum TaxID=1324776 RepID=UPI00254944FC|nr:uncharacterized protein N7483_004585 [Penicillium malachiteum]KAJ5730077.1 hypothetical protein N7483_004585 [Penicillium malachiteum]